ncbi:ATP-binding protein [Flavilitoribacter nigricans]|nr:ATP-binding protein [Flavilitoribacter nigricans]
MKKWALYPILFVFFFLSGSKVLLFGQNFERFVSFPNCDTIEQLSFDAEKILKDEASYSDFLFSIDTLQSQYCFAKRTGHPKLEASTLLKLSYRYPDWYPSDSAFYHLIGYLEESEKISKEHGFNDLYLRAKSMMVSLFTSNGMYNYAKEHAGEQLEMALSLGDSIKIAESYMVFGRIYREMKEYPQADSVLALSLAYQETLFSPNIKGYTYLHLSNLKRLEGQYEQSIEYARLGLEVARGAIAEPITIRSYLAKEMILSLIELKAYEEAEPYFRYLEEHAAIYNRGEAEYRYLLGITLEGKGEDAAALEEYLQAFNLAEEIRENKLIINISERLMRSLGKRGELSPYAQDVFQKSVAASKRLDEKQKIDDLFKRSFTEMESEREALHSQLDYTNQVLLFAVGIILLIAFITLLIFQNSKKNRLLAEKNQELVDNEVKFREMRNNLFANLSHEFRTPLTVMKTTLQDMSQGEFTGSYQDYSAMLLRNTESLTNLTGQMLDLAKMSEQSLVLRPEPLVLGEFINAVLEQLSALSDHKDVELYLERPVHSFEFEMDRDALFKIVQNLVYNAIKFTPEGGTIQVKLNVREKDWQLMVADNGKGMEREKLTHIFDRYFREVMDKSRPETGGLGLALTKQLVDLHNGDIAVESEPERGTTFTVSIPYGQMREIGTRYGEREEIRISMHNFSRQQILNVDQELEIPLIRESGKPQILIVEDNPDLNTLLFDKLKDNYQVIRAYNGREALQKLEQITPDLILTDLMMPEMNGFEFVEQQMQNINYSHIPVIVVSALESDTHGMKLWKDGIIDFVHKPFDLNILQFKIVNLLRSREDFKAKLFKEDLSAALTEAPLNAIDKVFLTDLTGFFDQHLDEELNVEQISQAVAMSRSNLYNKVKSLTGHSPTMFLRKYRMKKAHELLTQQAGNVSEVAYRVGYFNASQFSKTFKEEFGVSPSSLLRSYYKN